MDLFSSDHSLVVPAHTIKQRVFLLLMHAVTMDAKDQGTPTHLAIMIGVESSCLAMVVGWLGSDNSLVGCEN